MSKISKLEGKIDEIIEMLIDGKSYRQIAEYYDIPLTTLHNYTSKPEHYARTREALVISASTFDDKAEQVLKDAQSDKNEIQRANCLAQHYRWKAAKRAPSIYSERSEIKHDLQSPLIIAWNEPIKPENTTDIKTGGGESTSK
jgi:hypothetical protein